MKKHIVSLSIAAALMAPIALGLAGCGNNDNNQSTKANVKAKDVYAMSAITGSQYLQNLETENTVLSAADLINMGQTVYADATSRPNALTNEDVAAVNNFLGMFEEMLLNNGINQTSSAVAEDDEYFGTYNILLTMNMPTIGGGTETFKMYYNETETETEREIEADEEEIEVSTKLVGIMIIGNVSFDVTGERKVETEGNETETSIEFTTKSKTNPDNYVKVSQEIENNEIEYEYSIYENGRLVSKTQVEFENEDGEQELSLQFKSVADGTLSKTKYLIKKKADNNKMFKVNYSNDVIKDTFTITITDNGNEFAYSNGFSEIIN